MEIERLCGHHDVGDFEVRGDRAPWFVTTLRNAHQDLVTGLFDTAVFYVAVEEHKVIGYIAIRELQFRDRSQRSDQDDKILRYIYMATFAVDKL